jgi:Restriction endonuclease
LGSLDWQNLSPAEFENLCFDLLLKEGFTNVVYYGGSGDRARDFVGESLVSFPDAIENIKYLIQCKRILGQALSVSDISSVKEWMDASDEYRRTLIMITTNVSPNTRDWISSINKKSKYTMTIWDKFELEQRLSKHSDVLHKYFANTKVIASIDLIPLSVEPAKSVLWVKKDFQTNGGEILIAGGMTGLTSVSGSSTHIQVVIDGNKLNPQIRLFSSLPMTQNLAWRTEDLSEGKHTIELYCKPERGKLQAFQSKLRIVELPHQELL